MVMLYVYKAFLFPRILCHYGFAVAIVKYYYELTDIGYKIYKRFFGMNGATTHAICSALMATDELSILIGLIAIENIIITFEKDKNICHLVMLLKG